MVVLSLLFFVYQILICTPSPHQPLITYTLFCDITQVYATHFTMSNIWMPVLSILYTVKKQNYFADMETLPLGMFLHCSMPLFITTTVHCTLPLFLQQESSRETCFGWDSGTPVISQENASISLPPAWPVFVSGPQISEYRKQFLPTCHGINSTLFGSLN
jgi:hypothetical protein